MQVLCAILRKKFEKVFIMSYVLKIDRPAQHFNANWREGLPLGNGNHGALVYGYMGDEKIMLSHARIWRDGINKEMPDVSDCMPKMKELILAGRMPEADAMMTDALHAKGYYTGEALPIPACDVRMYRHMEGAFRNYTRTLDLEKEEASVTYRDEAGQHSRRAFVSFADDVVVIEENGDVDVKLTVHATDEAKAYQVREPKQIDYLDEDGWICIAEEEDGREHGAVARVIKKGGSTLILARVFYKGPYREKWQELKEGLLLLEADYETLFARHIGKFTAIFGRVELHLEDRFAEDAYNAELLNEAYQNEMPNRLAERMWAYGRYLLICGTTTGGLPCPLLGLWNGEYQAFWAMNMANINLEMIYWQAMSGNLSELMLPVFDYYEAGMDDMRENARKLYGLNGIFLPAVSTPASLKLTCIMPHIANWTSGAGWIAQMYYEYYLFTKDDEFLRSRAYPFMMEAAAFYQDFITWNKDHTKWVVVPSVSSENHTSDYRCQVAQGKKAIYVSEGTQSSINSTMDIAVIRELFLHLCAVGEKCGATPEQMKGWKAILDGSPAYEANADGAIREWQHPDYPDNYYHRHQSHLYPVFPGRELADAEDKEMFHKAGLLRMTRGIHHQTSWSLTQNANMMARCKDGENAWNSLNYISKTTLLGNLFTVHNDWRENGITMKMNQAPFQIDANIGWSAAVQEMLLYSSERFVEPLPALPKKWKSGAVRGLIAVPGVKTDVEWDEKGASIAIEALRDTSFTLRLRGKTTPVSMKKGERLSYQF